MSTVPPGGDEGSAKNESRKKASAAEPLLFRGMQPQSLTFRGVAPFDGLDSESPISDSVWDMIRSGKIIPLLPPYLGPTEDIKKLKIKVKDEDTCNMVEGWTTKVSVTKNKDGTLGFLADSSRKGGTEAIRLMIATAKCAAKLEVDIRIKQTLGDNASGEQKKTAKEEILRANPKLFHFTITTCANAQDVALMLIEMKKGDPILEPTLAPNVIAAVRQNLSKLSPDHQKIIKEQLDKQMPPAPSPTPTTPLSGQPLAVESKVPATPANSTGPATSPSKPRA